MSSSFFRVKRSDPIANPPVPPIEPLRFDGERVTIIDQTLLPHEERWIDLPDVEAVREAIYMLRIRGAPAIGIAAAYGMVIASRQSVANHVEDLLRDLAAARDRLANARPTAVNLRWAVERVYQSAEQDSSDVEAVRRAVLNEAEAIRREDLEACRRIAEYGLELLGAGPVITHCNTGGLATSGYGTALAPIYLAQERGRPVAVFVDETRPLLQGARLTAWELLRAGIEALLMPDSAAASVLARGEATAVIVGADRVAANGDVANKIGTLPLAIAAHEFGVPFYVAVPLSTVDLATPSGADIPIEERDPREVTEINGQRIAPAGAEVFNPAFDITPHRFVTAIITDAGVVEPPFTENLAKIFQVHAEQ